MQKRLGSKWVSSKKKIIVYKPGYSWVSESEHCSECGRSFKQGEQHWLLQLNESSKKKKVTEFEVCKKCFPQLNNVILDKSK